MNSELSIEMRERAAAAEASDSFGPPAGSRFEKRIIEWLCEPLLPRIPASVHPNTISLVTHAVAWITAALAVSSVFLLPAGRALCLVGAGVGMLVSMIGDCIDGMHARRTKQCSKLGEMMDHWLDAIIVPLTIVGITVALEMEPWAIATLGLTATMIYNGQLVLYHHTGRFVHPEPATGVEGQFGISIGYVGLAGLFYFVPRDRLWLDVSIGLLAMAGIIVQMRCNLFYYRRLTGYLGRHAIFVAMAGSVAALYLLQAIDLFAFMFLLVFVSFRICGTYVLNTIVKRPYNGNDWGLVAFIAAIALCHYVLAPIVVGGTTLEVVLPYVACVYAATRNFIDFARDFSKLA